MKKVILFLGLFLGLSSYVDSAIIYTYKILEVRIDVDTRQVSALIQYTATDDNNFQKTNWVVFVTTNAPSLLKVKGEIDSAVLTQ